MGGGFFFKRARVRGDIKVFFYGDIKQQVLSKEKEKKKGDGRFYELTLRREVRGAGFNAITKRLTLLLTRSDSPSLITEPSMTKTKRRSTPPENTNSAHEKFAAMSLKHETLDC